MHLIDGYNYYIRPLGNGISIFVVPLTYGRARINIGDDDCYYEGW